MSNEYRREKKIDMLDRFDITLSARMEKLPRQGDV